MNALSGKNEDHNVEIVNGITKDASPKD
ncbi:protein of unknown function [Kyrpidia spormannii]|uniref:Uncharacterized protein n=2 Tax=Kyrpidia spormannii TaxID=2055160 RepID=A0ACA8Z757_9BACL|nr:protein of unknown function [Kyrpidia spormannii]CAB3392173.1 protein of unknown function [Kyrpidia spormannii]